MRWITPLRPVAFLPRRDLFRVGMVERSARYGTPGRPENEYRWAGTRSNSAASH